MQTRGAELERRIAGHRKEKERIEAEMAEIATQAERWEEVRKDDWLLRCVASEAMDQVRSLSFEEQREFIEISDIRCEIDWKKVKADAKKDDLEIDFPEKYVDIKNWVTGPSWKWLQAKFGVIDVEEAVARMEKLAQVEGSSSIMKPDDVT